MILPYEKYRNVLVVISKFLAKFFHRHKFEDRPTMANYRRGKFSLLKLSKAF